MNKLLFIFLIFSFSIVNGQNNQITFPEKDGKINLEEIVQVDSISSDQLYKRAKLWVINSFKSQKDESTTVDKELGIIKGTGKFSIMNDQDVLFSILISVKDYRIKYNFYDFIFLDNYGRKTKIDLQYYYDYYKADKKLGRKMMTRYLIESKEKIDALINSLKSSLMSNESEW